MYGGSAGAQGYGGAMGTGTGASGGVVGAAGAGNNGGTGAESGTGGMGGSGGLGGSGGIGASGGIAGSGGTAGEGGTGNVGGSGATTGSKDPKIPPVNGACPAFTNSTVTVMGLGGIQIVAGPKAAGPTAPMVWYWHGTGSTAGEFASMAAQVRAGVVAEGGVLVSFQGTKGGDLLSGTNIFGAADFPVVDQITACAVQNHNINPRRIFATGCSAGGLFSAALAARRSSYIAAAAPNSGGWVAPVQWENDYTPALMTVHGENDMVIVNFKTTSTTADNAFKGRGGFVVNCNHGGGHCGGRGLAPQIWEFFKAHPYGVDPKPWSSLPAGFPATCKIF